MKPKTKMITVLSALAALAAMNAFADPRPEDVPSQEPVIGAPGAVDGGNGTPTQQPDQQPGQQPGQNPGSCAAILRIDKQGPATAKVGDFSFYTIDVTNVAECAATGVDIVDTLPDRTVFVSANPTETTNPGSPPPEGGQVTWENQSFAAGETRQFQLNVHFVGPPSEGRENKACASQGLDPEICDSVFTDVEAGPPID